MLKNDTVEPNVIQSYPKFLWFLMLTYAMIIVLSNWFDPRLIRIFNLETDAGTLIFPFTFLLSNLLTEVYGYKHARRAIWCGFLFNALFIIYGQIVIHLPSPHYPTENAMFDTLLAANIRIIVASSISYFCAEPLNSFIMAKLKIKMAGRCIGLRFVLSTAVAAGVDSVVFSVLAFYGTMSDNNLVLFILTMWLIKVLIEIIGLPISVRLTKQLKQVEKLDIYDKKTSFNLLSLNTDYTAQDNEFA